MTEVVNIKTLAYAIGSIGILLEWRSYQLKSGKGFRRWSAIAAVLWSAQYLFLGAHTAGLTMASTAIRTLLSSRLEKKIHKHWVAGGFILIFSGLMLVSWQGTISLLPAFSVINTTLALFYLDNRNMRIAFLVSSLAWIANDLYWQAWPSLLAESVAMLINLHTIRKLFIH